MKIFFVWFQRHLHDLASFLNKGSGANNVYQKNRQTLPVAQVVEFGNEIHLDVIGELRQGDIFVENEKPIAMVIESDGKLLLRQLNEANPGSVLRLMA